MWRDILHHYDAIGRFLNELSLQKDATDTVKKLVQYFCDVAATAANAYAQRATRRSFLFELIVVVTYGRKMCQLTYYFERSKDMVICFAREKISCLLEFLRPNQDLPLPVAAVVASFENIYRQDINKWKSTRDALIKPVFDYLQKKFPSEEPKPTDKKKMIKKVRRWRVWQLFHFAELLRPSVFLAWYAAGLRNPNASDKNVFQDQLESYARHLPFLTTEVVSGLVSELSDYKVMSERFSDVKLKSCNLMKDFWEVMAIEGMLRWWLKVAKCVALFPVSTGDVERVVSVFTDIIDDDQFSSLESTIEARVMMRYNHRQPKARRNRRFFDDGSIPSDDE
jgi:hypothetical protein